MLLALDLVIVIARILRWRAALSGTDPLPQYGPTPRVLPDWNTDGTRIVWRLL